MRWLCSIVLLLAALTVAAGPTIPPGDLALRHDIQRLADYKIIKGTVTTWPLAWGPIMADIRAFETASDLPPDVQDALARVRARGGWETTTGELRYRARVAAAENPSLIRSFQDTPREEGEISAGLSWTGNWLSLDLNGIAVSDASDGEEYRPDGSHVAVAFGNWTVAASTLDRWWGPSWDGGLILSSNARPFPTISMDRTFTDAFKNKWLRWIGPWDLSIHFGELESDRAVPNAQVFAMRVAFRPIPSLEIGLSRSAQWCGDNRPCDFDTFVDLFLGRDNVGDAGIGTDNEPGNQLAGVDFRWSKMVLSVPLAFYGQFIGEDEAGGFPSRYIGQVGLEGTGFARDKWSYRWFAEFTSTSCDFWKTDVIFDCAYEHVIYADGYRYRGRPIGHAADNDARIATLGMVFLDTGENTWQGYIRSGELNRGGSVNNSNSVTRLPRDVTNIEIVHLRGFSFGRLEFGLGYDYFGGNNVESSSKDVRAFIQWRTDR